MNSPCCARQVLLSLLALFFMNACGPAGSILSADALTSLNSLEKLDLAPLYVMRYTGEYASPAADKAGLQPRPACSLFSALDSQDNPLFGRNFDWEYSPALLLFTDPPDGYASVSLVNLGFLDLSSEDALQLIDLPVSERTALLEAPQVPLEGMNAYGLAVGMAAVPESLASSDPAKPTIGSLGIMRVMLDHARNVEEARVIFASYNIDFSGGPPIHYLLADRSGEAVLLEYVRGQLVAIPNDQAWHLATNHLRASAVPGMSPCWRYNLLEERLAALHGRLDPAEAMQLLDEVSQPGSTQWSAVYELGRGRINIALHESYSRVFTFELAMVSRENAGRAPSALDLSFSALR